MGDGLIDRDALYFSAYVCIMMALCSLIGVPIFIWVLGCLTPAVIAFAFVKNHKNKNKREKKYALQ